MEKNNIDKSTRITEIIQHAAADYIQRESNSNSMITVTNVALSPDFQKATIFVTVFPEDKEDPAIEFLRRNLHEFRDYLNEKTRLRNAPWLSFELDAGEKKRQRIDEISRNL
jgi:ribosome-binding factor A